MKLAQKAERRRLRQLRQPPPPPSFSHISAVGDDIHSNVQERDTSLDGGMADKKGKGEVVCISWSNMQRSLATTRRSISEQEMRRLGAIYREFVVGRNGEMPSGEGGGR